MAKRRENDPMRADTWAGEQEAGRPHNPMDAIAYEWMAARGVIAKALAEWYPGETPEQYEHKAAAVMARLANHDPPILLDMQ